MPSGIGQWTYLRRHKLGSTTEGARCGSIPHVLLAETVVRNLDVSVQGQKNIVELQVTINDSILVEVLESQANFGSIESAHCLAGVIVA